jgi:NADH-quinone oxidoreductase subunit J
VTLEVVTFWGLAVLLIGSALSVVLTKNLFHSVLWLALSLTATAGIFLALEAEFLAAVQLLLYAGGVVTIVVFAIVVTERLVGERLTQTSRHIVTGVVLAGALLLAVLRFLRGADLPVERPVIAVDVTRALGRVLMTEFVLPFELLAVLLLVGLLGALYFARPEE